MAKFRITFTDDTGTDYEGDARYWFNDQGLLVVEAGDGLKVTFNPSEWRRIVEPETPPSMVY